MYNLLELCKRKRSGREKILIVQNAVMDEMMIKINCSSYKLLVRKENVTAT